MIVEASCATMLVNILPENQESALRYALAKIMVLSGVKTPPDDAMVNLILSYLRKHFKTISLEEILTAAELNLKGELETKIEHFNCLDVDFITKLIAAYRVRKARAFAEFGKAKNDKLTIEPPKKQTPQQAYNSLREHFITESEMPEFGDYWNAFDFMWKSEPRLTEDETSLKQFFEEFSTNYRAKLIDQMNAQPNAAARKVIELSLDPERVKMEARKTYVKKRIPELCKSQPKNSSDLFSPVG